MTGKSSEKTGLGNKRQCPECTAKFYDFDAMPVVCPKCKHSWQPKPPVIAATLAVKPKKLPPKILKKSAISGDEIIDADELELPEDIDDGGLEIVELETMEDTLEDIDSLDEVEEHHEDEEVDVDGDDADDEMFMEEIAGDTLIDSLDEMEEDEDEDAEHDDEDEDER
jgi:uncharacterized protein (TIGR02300 family)